MKILMLLSCQGLYLNDYIKYKLSGNTVDIISMRSMDYKFPYHFLNYNIQYDIIIIQGFNIVNDDRFCKLLQHNPTAKIIIFTFSKLYNKNIIDKYTKKYKILYINLYSKYISEWKKNNITDFKHLNMNYIIKIIDDVVDFSLTNNSINDRNIVYDGPIQFKTQKNSDIIKQYIFNNFNLIKSLDFIKSKKGTYPINTEINFFKKINLQLPLQFNTLYYGAEKMDKSIHLEFKNNIQYCSLLIPSIYCNELVSCIDMGNVKINNKKYFDIFKDKNWGNLSTTTVRCYDIITKNIKTIDIILNKNNSFAFYFFIF